MAGDPCTLKLSAARLWAAHRHPYFAAGLFAIAPVAAPGLGAVTVDRRWRLSVDPAVVAGWSVPETGAIFVHHLCHLLRDHVGRAAEYGVGEHRAADWNTACDAEINDDLVASGLRLPGATVTPADFGWPDGALAETYFSRLRRLSRPDGGDGPGDGRTAHSAQPSADDVSGLGDEGRPDSRRTDCGSGAHGRDRPWEQTDTGPSGVAPQDAALIRRRVADAVTEAGRRGADVPAGWRRWAEATGHTVLDWRVVLAAEIRRGLQRAAGRTDFTFTRRSRRASVSRPVVLPGTFRAAPSLAVVIDTSASMGTPELASALGELDGIIDRAGLAVRRVPVLACDTAVGALTLAGRAAEVQLTGGGGTDMGTGLAAAVQCRPRPQVVVVLTDGETPWPRSAPPGTAVVVAVVGPRATAAAEKVPRWARAVVVEEAT